MGFDSFLSPFPPQSSIVPVFGQTIGMRNTPQVNWNDNEKGGTHAIGLENYGHFHAETEAAWYIPTIQMLLTAAAAKSLQSCPTLCDPRDGSPPGSPSPGIPQAKTLEWVAISFSNAWKWKVKVKSLSCVRLLATPWTAAYQAPPSMGYSRQEYWSGVPLPSPNASHYLCPNRLHPSL